MLGVAAGNQVAGQRLVLVGAAGGEADGASLQGLLRQPGHGFDVLGRRMLAGDGALAHDIDPQGVVGDLRRNVDGARQPRERVEVIGEALPVPFEAFGQRDAGNVLHALHQIDQRLLVLLADGGEAHAAIAERDGRGAVPGGRRQDGIPGRLAVIVRVHIDPARRDDPPVGLHLAPAGTGLAADLDDAVAVDGDVALRRRRARAVNDTAAPDDDVVHCPSRLPGRCDRKLSTHRWAPKAASTGVSRGERLPARGALLIDCAHGPFASPTA